MKRRDHSVDWKKSMKAHKEICRIARNKTKGANRNSALAKSSVPVGVIAVNPK